MKISRARVLLTIFHLPFAICLLHGCATRPATLVVESAKRESAFSQTFSQSFAARTEDGTWEFVLVADESTHRAADGAAAVTASNKTDPKAPLKPAARPPLRQVVYVKVLWRPLTGRVGDAPATSNASIDWYVFADDAAAGGGAGDLLQYSGTGFVTVKPKGDVTLLDVRRSNMKPRATRGLTDPVGAALVHGQVLAVNDGTRVRETLAATKERAGAAAQASR